jgi:signal peptidase II
MRREESSRDGWWTALFFLAAALVVVADNLTKTWIRSYAGEQPIFEAGIFRIINVQNTGSSFGLFQDQNFILTIVAIVGIVIVLLFTFLVLRRFPSLNTWLSNLALGLILGGTIGNLIDRLSRGFVTDFIDIGIWPTFNIADSAMVIGVILIACFFIFSKGTKEAFSS